MTKITAKELYAQLYDLRVPDWEGEVDFYRELIDHSHLKAYGLLEVACGTGRIAMQLAKSGIEITGLDISPELLEIARQKSTGMSKVEWVLADMRAFEIERKFGFVISPGHSFQFMTTPEDQVKCLERIKSHLVPDGIAVIHLDHQDFGWLASLVERKESAFEKEPLFTHPTTKQKFCRSFLWTFDPATQNCTVMNHWEEINENGEVVQTWEMEPMRLHCVFRFEMEHLLRRVGFTVEAVYGDFFKNELTKESGQMIWTARNTAG